MPHQFQSVTQIVAGDIHIIKCSMILQLQYNQYFPTFTKRAICLCCRNHHTPDFDCCFSTLVFLLLNISLQKKQKPQRHAYISTL